MVSMAYTAWVLAVFPPLTPLTNWQEQQKKDVFHRVEFVHKNKLEAETPGGLLVFRVLVQV